MKQWLVISFFALALLPALPSQPVTLLTYNIRYDNPQDGDNAWPKRRDFLAAQILFHAPDVFGIQEGLHAQVEFLQIALPEYARIGVGRDDGREGGEYSALFYRRDRWQVLKSGTFWLSETPEVPSKGWDAALNRICTYALLQDSVSRQKLWVFNTHFDHVGKTARRASAELILHQCEALNPQQDPVVVMGDLNAEPMEEPVAMFRTHLLDAHDVSEIPAFGPDGTFQAFDFHQPVKRRIDYIFVGGRSLRVRRYAVLSDAKDCHYPSDHLPVLATIVVD